MSPHAVLSWLATLNTNDVTVSSNNLHLALEERDAANSDSLPELVNSKEEREATVPSINNNTAQGLTQGRTAAQESVGAHSQHEHASELSTIIANSINNNAVQGLTQYHTAASELSTIIADSINNNAVQGLTQYHTAASELSTIPANSFRLRREHAPEPSTIKTDSIGNNAGQDLAQYLTAPPENAGILQWERIPELRLLFQQPDADDDVRINVTAQKLSLRDGVLGVTDSKTELRCSLEANHIKVTMFFVPNKDDMVLFNDTSRTLFLETMPQGGFDSRSLPPKQYELIYPGFWRLSDNKTSIEFLLRPRRYRLWMITEGNKRSASEGLPAPKRGMLSTGAAATRAIEAPPARGQKTIVRRELASVDLLNSTGLDENQTLHMLGPTGCTEYSLKFIRRYKKGVASVDIFKANWDEGSKSRVVAVKRHLITTAEPYRVAASIKDWERELKAHKDLDHPCIAKLLGFDSRLLALMIEHRDLEDLSADCWCPRTGPKASRFRFRGDIDDACRIAADVSSALDYLAGHDIIHNDIKPANIIYGKAGGKAIAGALLIDFGLSRVMKDDNEEAGGTIWYLAPEWMERERGPPADVYSLGVVMLYLLRSIRLPEKVETCWDIVDAWDKRPDAVCAMKDWIGRVTTESDRLLDIVGSKKESKLRGLVVEMLRPKSDRIAVGDLVKRTREWAA